MNEMIESKLSQEDGNNFAAVIITPWQLHGVYAFFQFCKEKGINLNGYIFVSYNRCRMV